jgi:hypothetical protein
MHLQETKYRDAIRYYQPLVAANASNLLGVTAIVLANLCVSYIMTSQVRFPWRDPRLRMQLLCCGLAHVHVTVY